MCTLLVLNEVVDGYPLIVAANRDESLARPARSPELTTRGVRTIICPWDARGGTWIGAGRNGWFVGITNQDDGKHDDGKRTRGAVVLNGLLAGDHASVALALRGIDPADYNPFNLVFGRPGCILLCRVLAGEPLELQELPVGLSIVSNDCWGSAYDAKATAARRCLAGIGDEGSIAAVRDRLLLALQDHTSAMPSDPWQGLCVHASAHGWGTRSTSLITVSNEGHVEYWYSEGHACQSTGLRLAHELAPLNLEGTP